MGGLVRKSGSGPARISGTVGSGAVGERAAVVQVGAAGERGEQDLSSIKVNVARRGRGAGMSCSWRDGVRSHWNAGGPFPLPPAVLSLSLFPFCSRVPNVAAFSRSLASCFIYFCLFLFHNSCCICLLFVPHFCSFLFFSASHLLHFTFLFFLLLFSFISLPGCASCYPLPLSLFCSLFPSIFWFYLSAFRLMSFYCLLVFFPFLCFYFTSMYFIVFIFAWLCSICLLFFICYFSLSSFCFRVDSFSEYLLSFSQIPPSLLFLLSLLPSSPPFSSLLIPSPPPRPTSSSPLLLAFQYCF